jgi:hypothetical protein
MNCTCEKEKDPSGKCACFSCCCDDCECALESETDVKTQSDSSECLSTSQEDSDDVSEEDDEYDELEDDKVSILRGKWIYDGSSSIEEMIESLQREIALLNDLKEDGWVLQEKVSDDHAVLVKADV